MPESHDKWQMGILRQAGRQARQCLHPPPMCPGGSLAQHRQWEGGLALLFLGWVDLDNLNTLSVREFLL